MLDFPVRLEFPWGGGGNHVRWMLFLDDKIKNLFGTSDLTSKLSFLYNNVYINENINNWLKAEFKYRTDPNWPIHITAGHGLKNADFYYFHNWEKLNILYFRFINLELCLKRYIIIQPNLNGQSIRSYYELFREFNKKTILEISKKYSNKIVIDADCIFEETLNKDFYYKLIETLGLSDNYENAAKLHKKWIEMNKKLLALNKVLDKY